MCSLAASAAPREKDTYTDVPHANSLCAGQIQAPAAVTKSCPNSCNLKPAHLISLHQESERISSTVHGSLPPTLLACLQLCGYSSATAVLRPRVNQQARQAYPDVDLSTEPPQPDYALCPIFCLSPHHKQQRRSFAAFVWGLSGQTGQQEDPTFVVVFFFLLWGSIALLCEFHTKQSRTYTRNNNNRDRISHSYCCSLNYGVDKPDRDLKQRVVL